MRKQAVIFTADALVLMRQMAEQGRSATEIALAIGSTQGSVRVTCSREKIPLKRGRRAINLHAAHQDNVECLVTAHLPAPLYAAMRRKAGGFGLSLSALASKLLIAVAESDIYRAVLDEEPRSSSGCVA